MDDMKHPLPKQNSAPSGGPWRGNTVLRTGLGFFAGILAGLLFNLLGWGENSLAVAKILTPISSVYLNALKFIAIPVAFFSILTCVSEMADLKSLGRIGGRALLLFAFTSFLAIGVGLGLFAVIRPADGFSLITAEAYSGAAIAAPSLLDTLVGIVPDNIFAPFSEGNMLQIIFIALLLGLGLSLLGARGCRLRELAGDCYALFLRITSLLIALVPPATFCAMARLVASTGAETLLPLLKLLGGITAGMAAMLLLYALMLRLARLDPRVFYRKWAANLLLAFSLNCASATVPVTLDTCEHKLGVSPRVCSFTIPLGATVNMDGTCIYLTMSALFLTQVYGVELTFANQLAVVISIFVLSVGAPGVPGSGLVCLSLLATQLNIPMEGVGMLMGLDKLFGMMRSAVNVTSDAVNTVIVADREQLLDQDVFYAPLTKEPSDATLS